MTATVRFDNVSKKFTLRHERARSFQEAALAFRMLVEHLQGEDVPKLTITPMKVITMDNVDEAVPWEPTESSTRATLGLDVDSLYHDFAVEAGY